MKMQLRKILVLPAVDDQPIRGEIGILRQALNCGIQIAEKGGIFCIELHQRPDPPSSARAGRGTDTTASGDGNSINVSVRANVFTGTAKLMCSKIQPMTVAYAKELYAEN